jgi:ADYC domain-containing protein
MKRSTFFGPLLFLLAACPDAPLDPPAEPLGTVGSELSLNNGNGLSANGPGIGQPYGSFGAKQAAIGLAYVQFAGALTTGGAPVSSVGLVKGELRGTLTNGTKLQGAGFAGVFLRGRGLTAAGAVAASERTVRVDSAAPAVPGAPLQDADFYHYSIRVKDPNTGAFVDPCAGGYAIALPGKWDHRQGLPPNPATGQLGGGSYDPTGSVFTFACEQAAVQKCAEMAHYKPWQSIAGPAPSTCDPADPPSCEPVWTQSGVDALRACVRLVRGDFCGDGTPLTFDGTLIDGNDNYPNAGIEPDTPDHPDWPVEAGWTPAGASCVDQFRVTDVINKHIFDHCKERLSGVDGGCDLNATVLAPFATRSAPVLLNRSRRKMSVYLPAEPHADNHYGSSTAVYVDAPRKQHLLAIGAPRSNEERGLVHLFRVSTDPADLGARAFVAAFEAPAGVRQNELFGQTIAFRAGPSGPDLLIAAVQGHAYLDVPGAVWLYPFAGWIGDKPTFGQPVLIAPPVPDGSFFGSAMASTPDGRVFIGAPFTACPGGNDEAGSVFVLEPGAHSLTPLPNPACPAGWVHFGYMLRGLEDNSVLISSGREPTPNAACTLTGFTLGAVRRYQRQANGTFTPTWKLAHPECPTYVDGYTTRFAATARVGDSLVIGAANVRAQGVDGWGKLYVYNYNNGATPTLREMIAPPPAAAPGEFGHVLDGYMAAGTEWLAVPHHHGDGLYFFKRVNGSFVLEGRLKDPFGTTGKSMGSPVLAAPPFLYFSSHEATDSNLTDAGYFFQYNFDDAEPTPLPHP